MSDNKKVLILLGDKGCSNCVIFERAWNVICKDDNIVDAFYIFSFIGNGNVRGVAPNETRLKFPGAFNNIRTVPAVFIVSKEEYLKRWDIDTGRPVNQDLPITPLICSVDLVKKVNVGKEIKIVPNTEEVVRWILRNR